MLWPSMPKRRLCPRINQQVKKSLYNWILQHPQVVVSPIENYFLKLFVDGQMEPQLVPKCLVQVLVIELHNIMVSPKE